MVDLGSVVLMVGALATAFGNGLVPAAPATGWAFITAVQENRLDPLDGLIAGAPDWVNKAQGPDGQLPIECAYSKEAVETLFKSGLDPAAPATGRAIIKAIQENKL